MQAMYDLLSHLILSASSLLWGWPGKMPLIVILLVGTGVITTFRLGWIQIRYFLHGIRVIRGEFDDPEHQGDLSHFQALTTALSATVGIGNIAGVATALHYGGPGALFWMWVTAVFGMALKFTECTLAMKYRSVLPDGSAAGGPMYSIEKGLGRHWKPLAGAFAIFTIISSFGSGNAVQSFTVADQFRQDLGIPTWITGAVMASLVAMVILGGIKRIGRVTSKLVPFMAFFYIAAGLAVLATRLDHLPAILILILRSAFTSAAPAGGFAGASVIFMLTWGVKRGLFSNESGQGSAPIAHAAAKTDEPIREGVVAMLGPFIDTLMICTMTGLVILSTGVWNEKQEQKLEVNKQAAITAYDTGTSVEIDGVIPDESRAEGLHRVRFGRCSDVVLIRNNSTVDKAVLLVDTPSGEQPFDGSLVFDPENPGDMSRVKLLDAEGKPLFGPLVLEGKALQNGSPMTAWAFQKGLGKIAGGSGHLLVTLAVFLFALSTAISWSYYGDRAVVYLFGEKWTLPYRIIFCIVHYLGAVYSLELVWGFGDLALGLMTIPNLLSILLLTGRVKTWVGQYVRDGKMQPPHSGITGPH